MTIHFIDTQKRYQELKRDHLHAGKLQFQLHKMRLKRAVESGLIKFAAGTEVWVDTKTDSDYVDISTSRLMYPRTIVHLSFLEELDEQSPDETSA